MRPSTDRGTTLRWRLTLVYGAVAVAVGLVLLLLSVYLVDRALSAGQLDLPRGLAVQLPDGRVLTLEAFQESLRQQTLGRLVRQGLLALLLLGAVGVAASYLLAGRVLQPLQQITSTARRLSAQHLNQRISLPGPADELKDLADTFDALLDRLQAAFEAQRRFVADASHELRTPLAVMRTEVDVVLRDPQASVEDLRGAAGVVREATIRADRLVDSLLMLASTERLVELPQRVRVELGEASALAEASVREEAKQRRITVTSAHAPAAALGDQGLLERMVGNLIENAVRHNVDGGWVRIDVGTVQGQARVHVMNSGTLLAEEDVPALFEPFRRSGGARTARRGAGLGLSIVRAVVTAHGGVVTATPRPDGGLSVTVDLPRVP